MTRKLIATAMLTVLMFNMGGYFILYHVLEVRAAANLEERINRGDVPLHEFVEFRVTLELPYPVQEQQLQSHSRVGDGSSQYSITSHEYKDHTLTIVGVRDQWAQHVNGVMDAFNQAASGESNKDQGIIQGLSHLLQLYENGSAIGVIQSNSWIQTLNYGFPTVELQALPIPVEPQPPRA